MSKSISIRLNDGEWESLSKRIEESGMTQSDFIRAACSNCEVIILDPEHKLYTELVQLIEMVNEVRQTGVKVSGLKKGVKEICRLLNSLMVSKTATSS